MAASECWLKGIDLIDATQCALALPQATRSSRSSNWTALNHAIALELITPTPTAHQKKDIISLADFVLPDTLLLCKELAGFTNQRLSDLFGVGIDRLHVRKQLSLKALFLHSDTELSFVMLSAKDIKSVFERASQAHCSICAQLLQHSLVLRALCSTMARSASTLQSSWSFLKANVFKDECALSCAALLLYLSSASASTVFAHLQW
jgi:hypothetical protein